MHTASNSPGNTPTLYLREWPGARLGVLGKRCLTQSNQNAWRMGRMSQLNFLVSWRSNKNPFSFKLVAENFPKAHESTFPPCLVLYSILNLTDSSFYDYGTWKASLSYFWTSVFISQHSGYWKCGLFERKLIEPSSFCVCVCVICNFSQKGGTVCNSDKLRVLGGDSWPPDNLFYCIKL